MTFQELNLIPALLNAIKEQGYTVPSPIQEQAIPPLLEGRDLIGCAQTGTGKTAAFALPILQNLAEKGGKGIRALILTPTRELAVQIYDSFKDYGVHLWLKSTVVYGGVRQGTQVRALEKGVDILIATPGRLTDLMNQGFIDLSHVETFVLDEADRMLDMGFINDIRKVQKSLPEERQTLLFSATMPTEIEHLAHSMLRDPVTIKVSPVTSTVEAINQWVYYVDKDNKKLLLRQIIKDPSMKNALVFTRTKHGADRVVKELAAGGIQAVAIHGDKRQGARQEALFRFKSGMVKVLVATDIAARGIDVPLLSHVINYNVPEEAETYIHRIGRTGRAGSGGHAITLCCYDELSHMQAVERVIKKQLPEKVSDFPMEIVWETEKPPRVSRVKKAQKPSGASSLPEKRQQDNQPKSAKKNAAPDRADTTFSKRNDPKHKPTFKKNGGKSNPNKGDYAVGEKGKDPTLTASGASKRGKTFGPKKHKSRSQSHRSQ